MTICFASWKGLQGLAFLAGLGIIVLRKEVMSWEKVLEIRSLFTVRSLT